MKCTKVMSIIVIGASLLIGACNQNKNSQQKVVEVHLKASPSTVSDTGLQVCEADKAPKNVCFICDQSLRDAKRLW